MNRQEQSHERPIIAKRFYEQELGEERKLVLCVCGREAVVWDRSIGRFYCSRCWEYEV